MCVVTVWQWECQGCIGWYSGVA